MRAALAGLMLLGGCAGVSEHPLPADARDSLAGRVLSVSQAAPAARFELQGATRSDVYAVVGAVRGNVGVGVGASRPLTREPLLRLDDPAEKIGGALAETLQGKLALKPGAGDLVLHVDTTAWSAQLAEPATSTRYRVAYRAKARLIDSKDGRALAEGRCEARLDTATFDELIVDEGARLNADLARAGEQCVAQLRSKMGL